MTKTPTKTTSQRPLRKNIKHKINYLIYKDNIKYNSSGFYMVKSFTDWKKYYKVQFNLNGKLECNCGIQYGNSIRYECKHINIIRDFINSKEKTDDEDLTELFNITL